MLFTISIFLWEFWGPDRNEPAFALGWVCVSFTTSAHPCCLHDAKAGCHRPESLWFSIWIPLLFNAMLGYHRNSFLPLKYMSYLGIFSTCHSCMPRTSQPSAVFLALTFHELDSYGPSSPQSQGCELPQQESHKDRDVDKKNTGLIHTTIVLTLCQVLFLC